MAKTPSTIELNGKRYDARTGVMIDGFRSVAGSIKSFPSKKPPLSRAQTPSKHVHKTQQPSQTLMRRAVKKPSVITTRKTVAMDVVPHSGDASTLNTSFHTANEERFRRAKSIHKLPLVSRFGSIGANADRTTVQARAPQPISHTNTTSHTVAPATRPLVSAKSPISRTDKMLNEGMRVATSHQKPTLKKAKLHHRIGGKLGLSKKAASVVASSIAVLAVGGFFLYQNIPNLSVRYASAKAGVPASLPEYQPAGFDVSKAVEYSPGQLTIAYHANADERKYTITQKNTSWNSEALKDHLAAAMGSEPQSYPDNGQTIYLHNDSSADWVAGGVWYSITGDSKLNTDQLIRIATSLQ